MMMMLMMCAPFFFYLAAVQLSSSTAAAFSVPSTRLQHRRVLLRPFSTPAGNAAAAATKEDDGGLSEAIDAAAKAIQSAGTEISSSPSSPEALKRRSRALFRVGWVCWWFQFVLSVVSGVVLAFSRLVSPTRPTLDNSLLTTAFLFSSLGLVAAFFSVVWCWQYTRLARRETLPLEKVKNALRFGVILNLSGMAVTLISAEQVVGGLIAKLLLTPGALAQLSAPAGTMPASIGPVTALDIFVVQANTNTMCSHLSGLVASLYLLARSRTW
ncbi:hypothetical protein CTAYLR_003912 [Chrysophaeum taylorii]|uniref:Uncharacterized protein n=1 Tax=Chrysophaeum taylorii TaxID=2483200 RepID=A0AAD7XLT1_9STRA|nr:hypothetical protein CTAYLR_003912 [Chrysophaeum taylorii]